MILAGELSLWIALLMAAWTVTISLAGGIEQRAELVRSGERALLATFGFTLMAALGLEVALVSHEFSIRYVASYTSANLPTLYLVTSLWAGAPGSVLLWTVLLTTCAVLAVFMGRRDHPFAMPWVTATLGAIALLMLCVLCFRANPYQRLDFAPLDGRGLNPELQNPVMALHPPMLYVGLVATAVPFAFVIGALLARTIDAAWLRTVRQWTLVAWFFLTIGIMLGARWAYRDVVWAGVWRWDPMQNAALLPWLSASAFLHTMIVQERHGVLRRWNVALLIVTFVLSLLSVVLAHRGAAESLHLFAQSDWSGWFIALALLAAGGSWFLVKTRLSTLALEATLPHAVSRESALVAGTMLLLVLCFTTLWGTLFPLLSGLVAGQTVTIGAPYFNAVNGALGLLLLALMGAAPLLAWRRSSLNRLRRSCRWPTVAGVLAALAMFGLGFRTLYAITMSLAAGFALGAIVQDVIAGTVARRRLFDEAIPVAMLHLLVRHRRRVGSYLAHIGVTVILCAAVGRMFQREVAASLKTGDSVSAIDAYGHAWTFTSQGLSRLDAVNRSVDLMSVSVVRDGHRVGIVSSEKRQYLDDNGDAAFDPSTEPGIKSFLMEDVYFIFTGTTDADTATVQIALYPLMTWFWCGGLLVALGGLVVMWPETRERLP